MVEPLEPVVPEVSDVLEEPVPAPLDVPMLELFVALVEPDPLVSELVEPVPGDDDPIELDELPGVVLDEVPGVLLEVELVVSVELEEGLDEDVDGDVDDDDGMDEVEEVDDEDGGVDAVVVVVVVVVPERPLVIRSS